MREWGGSILEFVPEKGEHYFERSHQSASPYFHGWKTSQKEAIVEITEKVFSTARKYLEETTQKDTDFNTALVQELLQKVDADIAKESAVLKDLLTFRSTYKHEIYLRVCGYAVTEFERMAESFRARNDPQLYLEKNLKGPLFTKLKIQYNQTEA